MVSMTPVQWTALVEYLTQFGAFEPGDRITIATDPRDEGRTVRAQVVAVDGSVIDEIDIEADPSEGA